MSIVIPPGQGRAPSLYDEQLQRLQQEKRLFASFGSGNVGGKLGLRSARSSPSEMARETGGES